MVKLLEVIGRRADLTHSQFLRHLSTTHLAVVDRVPEFRNRVRRYAQNHLYVNQVEIAPMKSLSVATNADAIIEVWWDSVAEIRRAFEEPRYMEVVRPDELSFGDVPGAWGVLARETVIVERETFAELTKIFIFLTRRDDLDRSCFLSRWRETREGHLVSAPAFQRLVRRFVENVVENEPANSLPGMRLCDLVIELGFDSLQNATQFALDAEVVAATAGWGLDYVEAGQTLTYVGSEHAGASEWLRRRDA
jgi:hypothetical protein